MEGLEDFCCQNPECRDGGKRGAGNLRWHGWSSRKRGLRMLYCRTCQSYFSQRKGTALWRVRLAKDKALSVLSHVAEGCGMRQTARLTGVDKNTVCRLTRRAGKHARCVHEELVAISPLHTGDPVRREMGLRVQEAVPL